MGGWSRLVSSLQAEGIKMPKYWSRNRSGKFKEKHKGWCSSEEWTASQTWKVRILIAIISWAHTMNQKDISSVLTDFTIQPHRFKNARIISHPLKYNNINTQVNSFLSLAGGCWSLENCFVRPSTEWGKKWWKLPSSVILASASWGWTRDLLYINITSSHITGVYELWLSDQTYEINTKMFLNVLLLGKLHNKDKSFPIT